MNPVREEREDRRIDIRPLAPADRDAWQPLWAAYLAFYHAHVPDATTALTWQRLHDPAEPVHGLGAFLDDGLGGIVHYLFHRSTWTAGPYCYLQDLFTSADLRGQGIGGALIEAVCDRARVQGASRVYWLTHETNSTARRLYDGLAERSGFIQYRRFL